MPLIRIRHNYASILMDEHEVKGSRVLSKPVVDILCRYGQPIKLSYLGVRDINAYVPRTTQFLKVKGILTYFPCNDESCNKRIDLRLDHYCVGIYEEDGVFLALKDGKPLSFPIVSKCAETES